MAEIIGRFEEDVMAATTSQMGSFYNEELAASQLRKYREKGAIPSTQALIDALKAEGVDGANASPYARA